MARPTPAACCTQWAVPHLRDMTLEEQAWVAGFLEGEGHFGALRTGRPRKDGSHPRRCRVSAGQATREPLDKLLQLTGVGRVHGPYKNAGQGHYGWNVQRQEDVDGVVCAVFMQLSERRQRQILVMYEASKA